MEPEVTNRIKQRLAACEAANELARGTGHAQYLKRAQPLFRPLKREVERLTEFDSWSPGYKKARGGGTGGKRKKLELKLTDLGGGVFIHLGAVLVKVTKSALQKTIHVAMIKANIDAESMNASMVKPMAEKISVGRTYKGRTHWNVGIYVKPLA